MGVRGCARCRQNVFGPHTGIELGVSLSAASGANHQAVRPPHSRPIGDAKVVHLCTASEAAGKLSLFRVKHFGLLCGVPHSAPRLSAPVDFKETSASKIEAQFLKVHNWLLGLVA